MSVGLMRRAMTPEEAALARALSRCSFNAGSFPKRFARELARQAERPEPQITDAQAASLRQHVTRFRRQIAPHFLPESERYLVSAEAAERLRAADRIRRAGR